jgi:hypothetical protein
MRGKTGNYVGNAGIGRDITNPNMEWFKLEIVTFKFGDQKTVV